MNNVEIIFPCVLTDGDKINISITAEVIGGPDGKGLKMIKILETPIIIPLISERSKE